MDTESESNLGPIKGMSVNNDGVFMRIFRNPV